MHTALLILLTLLGVYLALCVVFFILGWLLGFVMWLLPTKGDGGFKRKLAMGELIAQLSSMGGDQGLRWQRETEAMCLVGARYDDPKKRFLYKKLLKIMKGG